MREIGGFIGTGDQSNFLEGGGRAQRHAVPAREQRCRRRLADLERAGRAATAPAGSNLVFELLVNRAHVTQATPSVTYTGSQRAG